jgi:hypothetical protein
MRQSTVRTVDAGIARGLGDADIIGHAAYDQRVNVVVEEVAKQAARAVSTTGKRKTITISRRTSATTP